MPKLNLVSPGGGVVHIMPTPDGAAALAKANPPSGLLTYHGGPVMAPNVEIYNIYWRPASRKLQNGAATVFSGGYRTTVDAFSNLLPGHGVLNIATQYNGTNGYVDNSGGLAA